MKTLILFSGFLLFFGSGSDNTARKTDLQRQQLKGKVKRLINCQFPILVNGKADTIWSTIYIFTYDEQGNQVADEDYTGGSIASGFGKLNHKRTYTYDEHGSQAGVTEYNAAGDISQRVVYKYDEHGNRTERCNYKADGKLWRRSVFRYNDRGYLASCNKYDGDSTLLEQFTYRYDVKGDLVEELLYVNRIKDTVGMRRDLAKPDDTMRSKVVRLDYMKMYAYDDSGKRVKEQSMPFGATTPFVTIYRYTSYDSAGNWLRQYSGPESQYTNITDRIIEYYR